MGGLSLWPLDYDTSSKNCVACFPELTHNAYANVTHLSGILNFYFVAAMGVEPIIFQYDTRRGYFLNK